MKDTGGRKGSLLPAPGPEMTDGMKERKQESERVERKRKKDRKLECIQAQKRNIEPRPMRRVQQIWNSSSYTNSYTILM